MCLRWAAHTLPLMHERRSSDPRARRNLWVVLALLDLVLLGLSLPISAALVDGAEVDARERAGRLVDSVVSDAVPPPLTGDIVGTARRDLLERLRSRALDDTVTRVLVWTPFGELIFSSAEAQVPSETIPRTDLHFSQAAAGAISTFITDSTESSDRVHRTFVPVRASDGGSPYAVAQIDQRYSAIVAQALRFWRPVQLALLGALAVLGGLIVYSFRRERHAVAAQPVLAEKTAATLSLEERLREAEAEAAKAKERLATAERQIKDASTLQIPASIVAQVDELEARVAAHAAEREQSDSEMQRLGGELEARNAELVTKDSELAQAREIVAAKDAQLARSSEETRAAVEAETASSAKALDRARNEADVARKRFEEAERRAARGDERVEDAERRAADATQRLALAETRITELERALRQVERAAFDRTAPVGVQNQGDRTKELRAAKDETAALQGKLNATEAALAETKSALIEANASLADARAKLAGRVREERPPPAASGLEIEVLRAERDVAKADLLRVQNELERLKAESGAVD
jgi:hypothetical protein